jgi:hypothetical protein
MGSTLSPQVCGAGRAGGPLYRADVTPAVAVPFFIEPRLVSLLVANNDDSAIEPRAVTLVQ